MDAEAEASRAYNSVINEVLDLFSVDAEDPARRLTTPMRLDLAIALRKDPGYRDIKERQRYLERSVKLLESIASENPDRLRYQIEYARSLYDLACNEPMTEKEIQENPTQATIMRSNRGETFTKLRALLNTLHERHPEDNTIVDLLNNAISAEAQFQGAEDTLGPER